MNLVPSLLQAIVHLEGEALVLHVGEKPYVVTPRGQVDLATRGLTLDAVVGIVNQLMPAESQNALDEFGAAQYQLPAVVEFPGEHFTVVAARGGDDVWAEIRRRRVPDDDRVPMELFAPTANAVTAVPHRAEAASAARVEIATAAAAGVAGQPAASASAPASAAASPPTPTPSTKAADSPSLPNTAPLRAPAPPAIVSTPALTAVVAPFVPPASTVSAPPLVSAGQPAAAVLPLTKSPIRPEAPPPLVEHALSSLGALLRLAAARGASTLYLSSEARPSIRVDGDVQELESAPLLAPSEVESLLLGLMPEQSAEAMRTGAASEWICDIADLGRVRCMSFRDHRGPGGVFRVMPGRAISAEQLALSREIQALVLEPEGLVLVSGPRSSGKRTLMAALLDLINRTRRDHVISIESEINLVHERSGSFISQREVRDGGDLLALARAALREDPDVLVVEELRSAPLMNLALDAAASGRLVIGGFAAPNASGAIDRIIDLYPSDTRRQVQLSLAQSLRGVVAQVLLRKIGGGRVAAREVLLNTPAVRTLLAEGRTSQLPSAIEGGRAHGMTPLNDALVGYVQSGMVDVREAYRRAVDRPGFLALLKRQGLDVSDVERSA